MLKVLNWPPIMSPSDHFMAAYVHGRCCKVSVPLQGPRSKFSSWGAKEECVKENLGGGPGGACLWISIQFL